MSDLIEFLTACLAEDERKANAELAFARHETVIASRDRRRTPGKVPCAIQEMDDRATRMLREVAAKRALLEWLDRAERWLDQDDLAWHRLAGGLDIDWARQLLAQPYKDHPEWREEWAA